MRPSQGNVQQWFGNPAQGKARQGIGARNRITLHYRTVHYITHTPALRYGWLCAQKLPILGIWHCLVQYVPSTSQSAVRTYLRSHAAQIGKCFPANPGHLVIRESLFDTSSICLGIDCVHD
jgi:hypothetical protein